MQLLHGYRFWEWFTKNQERYLHLDQLAYDDATALFDELNEHLDKYCRELSAEFHMADPYVKKMELTAKGCEQYFELAEDLVLMAPKLNGWKFVALREALWDFPVTVEYEGIEASSDQST